MSSDHIEVLPVAAKEKLPAVHLWLHINLHKAHSLDSMWTTKCSRGRSKETFLWKAINHFHNLSFFFFLGENFPLILNVESSSPIWDNYCFLQCFLIHSNMNTNNARWAYLSKLLMENRKCVCVHIVCTCVCIRGRDTGGNMERQLWMSTALEDWLSLLFSRVKQIQCELAENYLLQLMYCNCSGHIHKEEDL